MTSRRLPARGFPVRRFLGRVLRCFESRGLYRRQKRLADYAVGRSGRSADLWTFGP